MRRSISSQPSAQVFLARYPWLTAPLDWLDSLLTPRQWPRLADAGAAAFSGVSHPDSTQLTAILSLFTGIIGALSAQLRKLSPAYCRLDWRVRKLIWMLIWGGTVLFRYRPKRVWPPIVEDAIEMV